MRLAVFLSICAAFACVWAESNRQLAAKKIDKPPTVDGIVDASEWSEAAESKGFYERFSGKETAFTGSVMAAYDAENAYFAIICADPSPGAIRATEYRRDADLDGNDQVSVAINPFGTFRYEDFNIFSVNPRGATAAEFAGGRAAKREWQGEWEAKARTTVSGWEAEFRIPWRILRLPGSGTRDLTVNFLREVPRTQQESFWSNLGPEERIERTGVWQGVELPAVRQDAALQALQYQVTGADEHDGGISHSGADFRYPFGSKLSALATINPDFENVESAILGIEFSRFERLADERRPFFVEGEEFFRFGGMHSAMFAPQRIGQIDFGAKFFGNLGDEDTIGALVTSRFGHESASVLRYRHTWGANAGVTIGHTFLTDPATDVENHAMVVSGSYRRDRWGGSADIAFTSDSILDTGHRYSTNLNYREGALFATVGWSEVSADFRPRLGFQPTVGFRGFSGFAQYERSYLRGPLSTLDGFVFFEDTDRIDGQGLFRNAYQLGLDASTRSGISFDGEHSYSNFQGLIDRVSSLGVGYPATDPYRNVRLNYSFGTIEGERYREVSAGTRYRFPFRLSVGAALQFVDLGGERETQHIFNVSYELSEFDSVLGRAVLRDGRTNWYMAYRRSGNRGIEYYLIVGDPNANEFKNRLVLKVVAPFEWALR